LSGGAVGAGGGTLAVDRRWCGVREVRRMRIASFNVENLFDRAKALNQSSWAEGREVLEAHAALNKLLNKPKYSPGDKNQIVKLLDQLGLAKKDDGGPFALLRQNRGRLLKRPRSGGLEIVANGRGDWIGWVELKTEAVNERATRNTARVITDVGADVLAVVEAESRVALKRFTDTLLIAGGQAVYGHVMVIDGNDDRGIDVGILTTAGFPIGRMRSHVDDTDPAGRVFSRDCPEYEVTTPGGERIVVLVNHLKSKGYGKQSDSDALRHRQATRIASSTSSSPVPVPPTWSSPEISMTPRPAIRSPRSWTRRICATSAPIRTSTTGAGPAPSPTARRPTRSTTSCSPPPSTTG
jgi:hypothetical protein